MSTVIRAAISERNKYWIEAQRYYELKHFCMQYPIWKTLISTLDSLSRQPEELEVLARTNHISDPTARCAEEREYYLKKMRMVEQAANQTDPDIGVYILEGVTEGFSYDKLNARIQIPCCKNIYYDLYRKFFWLLDQIRDSYLI